MSAYLSVAFWTLAAPLGVAAGVACLLGSSLLLERLAERVGLPGAVGFFAPITVILMGLGAFIGALTSGLL